MPSKIYRITVTGRVQGVGFRNTVYRIATRHGIAGHVRNLQDGTVEIIAGADHEDTIDRFLELIRTVRGPARVDEIEKSVTADFSFPDRSFRIAY